MADLEYNDLQITAEHATALVDLIINHRSQYSDM